MVSDIQFAVVTSDSSCCIHAKVNKSYMELLTCKCKHISDFNFEEQRDDRYTGWPTKEKQDCCWASTWTSFPTRSTAP